MHNILLGRVTQAHRAFKPGRQVEVIPLGPNVFMLADHSSTGDLSDTIETRKHIKFFPDHVVESNNIQIEQLNECRNMNIMLNPNNN